jgi:hypothetical protein
LFLPRKTDSPWRVFEFDGSAPRLAPKGNTSPVGNRTESTYLEV